MASPVKARLVNVPQPAGTELPVNEKPRTVVPAPWTINPAVPASPPEPPETVAPPSILNWKPPIAVSALYKTEPSKR